MVVELATAPPVHTHRGAAGYRVSRLLELTTLSAGVETLVTFTPTNERTYYLPPTGRGGLIVTGGGSNAGPAPVIIRVIQGVYPGASGPGSLPADADRYAYMYGTGSTIMRMVPFWVPCPAGPYDDLQVGITPLLHPNWQASPGSITVFLALMVETATKDGYPLVEVPGL